MSGPASASAIPAATTQHVEEDARDAVGIRGSEPRIEWQAHATPVEIFGAGKIGRPHAERAAIVAVAMERDEVDARPDAARAERLDHRRAIDPEPLDGEPDDVEVPCRLQARRLLGDGEQVRCGESIPVACDERPSCRVEGVELPELCHAQGGEDVGQVVLEADVDHLVGPGAFRRVPLPGIPRHPVEAPEPHPVCPVGTRGRDHAAFGGGHVFRRIEAEHGRVGQRADRTAAHGGRQRVGRVVDDRDPGPARDRAERVEVAGKPTQVDRDDGPRAAAETARDLVGADVPGPRIDVGEDRPRAEIENRFRARREGEGRDDHLVARPDVERLQRQQQRVRTRSAPDGVPAAGIGGHLGLQGLHLRAQDEVALLHHPVHGLLDLAADGVVLGSQIEQRDWHSHSFALPADACGAVTPASSGFRAAALP